MSERDELERRLDAAFRETRPRRGFEDELWARLQARRPWWRRAGDALERTPWRGMAAGLVALALVGLLLSVVRFGGLHGGGGAPRTTTSSRSSQAPAAQPEATGPSRADTAGAAPALLFGRLPAPKAAGAPQVVRPAGPSALPAGDQGVSVQGASPPQPAPGLTVYRYDPAAGPADGTILETSAVAAGLQAAVYPSRPPAEADAAAEAGTTSGEAVVLTRARLVYVAVVSGREGYLEPAYLYTGTAGAGGVPVQVLVPALAASALQ